MGAEPSLGDEQPFVSGKHSRGRWEGLRLQAHGIFSPLWKPTVSGATRYHLKSCVPTVSDSWDWGCLNNSVPRKSQEASSSGYTHSAPSQLPQCSRYSKKVTIPSPIYHGQPPASALASCVQPNANSQRGKWPRPLLPCTPCSKCQQVYCNLLLSRPLWTCTAASGCLP